MSPKNLNHKVNVWLLSRLLPKLAPEIYLVDDSLFIDFLASGLEKLTQDIVCWPNVKVAQSVFNEISVSKFIDEICGDEYEFDDEGVLVIIEVFKRAISAQIKAKFPNAVFHFETRSDNDDVTIALVQEADYRTIDP
jgi:hypothetical protein